MAFNDPPPACSMVEANCSKATLISAEASLGSAVSMALVGSVHALNAPVAAALSFAASAACNSCCAGDSDHSLAAWQKTSAWLTVGDGDAVVCDAVGELADGLVVGLTEDPALSTPLPQPVRIRRAAAGETAAARHITPRDGITIQPPTGHRRGYGAASRRVAESRTSRGYFRDEMTP